MMIHSGGMRKAFMTDEQTDEQRDVKWHWSVFHVPMRL
jgi:hypothetical protein